MSREGEYKLFVAVRKCDLGTVKKLIGAGVSANVTDSSGETPLHIAARVNCVKVLHYLLQELHLNPNILCQHGRTPLMIAAEEGHSQIAELLIRHGADVDLVNPHFGFTPLMRAAVRGRVEVVKLLVDRGANHSLKDNMGHTALDHAQTWGKDNVVKILEKADTTAGSETITIETPRVDYQVDSTDTASLQPESLPEAEMVSETGNGNGSTDARSNPLIKRLKGILDILKGVHTALDAGKEISTTISGSEKETFIKELLSRVLPPPFRLGTGQAIDGAGTCSNQLDVVIEYPFLPSFPIVGTGHSRLYLAEGIAAVVEVKTNLSTQVKSNLSRQRYQVVNQAESLAKLKRSFATQFVIGTAPGDRIPFFAAGYKGWSENLELVREHLLNGYIHGALQISPAYFVSAPEFGNLTLKGPEALWGFITCIYQAISALKSVSIDLGKYGQLIRCEEPDLSHLPTT